MPLMGQYGTVLRQLKGGYCPTKPHLNSDQWKSEFACVSLCSAAVFARLPRERRLCSLVRARMPQASDSVGAAQSVF